MRAVVRRTGAVLSATIALSMPPVEALLSSGFPAFGYGTPKDSGNSWKSGNYRSKGRQVNSGNFSNANGAVKSNNVHSGSNFANGPQCIIERKRAVKRAC
ncbi:hypothetical protein [Nonomuraea basaltis]|uniref:hypothetical protein n=1 Tax=Nonomuraea basaltis TaxID=2495887 RepID=UPI00110C5DE8|nr:hypothetical protein [Nonomuraea basaltis]TMR92096.1 hypothetical protein EJK15_46535 [Nonomuraea basaltis]